MTAHSLLLLLAAFLLALGAAAILSGRGAQACIRGVLLTAYGAVLAFTSLLNPSLSTLAAQTAAAAVLLVFLAIIALLSAVQRAASRERGTDASERKRLKE